MGTEAEPYVDAAHAWCDSMRGGGHMNRVPCAQRRSTFCVAPAAKGCFKFSRGLVIPTDWAAREARPMDTSNRSRVCGGQA
eukprot:359192-Chlamydomonas_euryale.AAC.2